MGVNELDEAEARLAVRCARMFFLEDRSKVEIADELGLSRFKVARLLCVARDTGLVTITVNEPGTRVTELADELRRRFSLRDVVVVPTTGTYAAVGRAGAEMLGRHLRAGDVLGIGWGRTVEAVVSGFGEVPTPVGVDVVQLAGGVVGPGPAYDPTGIAARAAAALGGTLTPLHAPAFLGSAATRRALLAEPSIAAAVAAFDRVTIALFGVGAIGTDSDSALVAADSLPTRARQELARGGATADVACHFFDAEGNVVKAWESRTLAIGLDALQRAGVRIGVAAGHTKGRAVLAALRSGTVNALVADAGCASAITALP
jgi:DNA-binding transcriptional regulator LsrR (DeoR family)